MGAVNVDKLINDLLGKYKESLQNVGTDENIELEIRFKDITKEVFENLFNVIRASKEFDNGRLECSINAISENIYERGVGGKLDETRYIRQMIFTKGIKMEENYVQKIRLIRPVHVNDYVKYIIGLSKEVKSKKFSTTANALIRFKVRASFDFIGSPPHPAVWRFDLTAIRQGSYKDLGSALESIKSDLFKPNLTIENYLSELNFDQINEYEVEIERIDKRASIIPEDLAIVRKIYTLVNPEYLSEIAYQEEIYRVAEYIINNPDVLKLFKTKYRLKNLSNQPRALTKNIYYSTIFPPDGYFLTEKADGVRCVISINGRRCRAITSSAMYEVKNNDVPDNDEVTIVDSELIYKGASTLDGKNIEPSFDVYIFDIMVFRDENVANSGFATRIKHLEDAGKFVHGFLSKMKCSAGIKNYVRLDGANLERGFREVYERKYPYEIDGLIITEPDEPYAATKNYKWKPLEHTTIDFMAVKCPQKMLGIKPYMPVNGRELYLLFVGIDHKLREKLGLGLLPNYKQLFPDIVKDNLGATYYPIQFSPSINPLAYIYYHDPKIVPDINRKIIELRRDVDNKGWEFVRVREDRKLEKGNFGNDYKVAELNLMNYIDKFSFEELWNPQMGYFTKTASDIHTAPNKFKRFVISMLLKDNLSNSRWVIDEAAGRGADLHRYQEIGVENALFIDIDATAIAELIRRKFEYFAIKKWAAKKGRGEAIAIKAYDKVNDIEYDKIITKDTHALTIHTLVADLKTPSGELIEKTFQFGINPGIVDGIVCNFAIHYLCDRIENVRNVLRFNAAMLKVGGIFMFTVMDGAKIFELLREFKTGETWKVDQDGVAKYAIMKKYKGDKLSAAGQNISVLMPFSDEMYEEPLCNLDTMIAEAHKLGFEVELNESFGAFIDRFAKADRILYEKLTPDDRHYIGLYSLITLRKVRVMGGKK